MVNLPGTIPEPIKEANAKVEAAKGPAKRQHKDWNDYHDYVDGSKQRDKLVAGAPPEIEKDVTTVNLVKALLDTMVAMLTLSTPPWYVAPLDPAHDEFADTLTEWMQQFYYRHNLPMVQWQCYTDVTRLGNGFIKVFWDEVRKNARAQAVSPFMVYPDPSANCLGDCEFVAFRNVYGKERAKRMWGEDAIDWSKAKPVRSADTLPPEQQGMKASKTVEQVEVWEVYEEFGERQVIFTGNQVIRDRRSPIPEQRFPVIHFEMWPNQNTFWSESVVAQVMGVQDEFNKLCTRLATWFRFYVSPVIFSNDPQLEVDVTPGSTVLTNPETQAEAWVPPALPGDVFAHLSSLGSQLDTLTGIYEVERGVRPKGLTSGISLEVLQRASRTRQAGPAMFWGNAWGDVGQMLLELMQVGYAEERRMPAVNGGQVEMLSVSPQQLSAGAGEQPFPYEVVVQAEGKLPRSEAADAEAAMNIAQIVPWDLILPELLDAINFPDKHKVVKRFTEMLQAQSAGQQQAAQAAADAAGVQAQAEAEAEAQAAAQAQQQAPQQAPAEPQTPEQSQLAKIADQLLANLGQQRMVEVEQARQQGLTLQEVPQLAAGIDDPNLIDLLRMYLSGSPGF